MNKLKFISRNVTTDQAKDTGMAMVLILLLLGFLLENTLFFKIAVPTLIINMVVPNIFMPIAIFWFGLSHTLGTVVSRILLTLIFFIIVTPIGIIRRIVGFDSLNLKNFKGGNDSVMKIRNIKFSPNDIEKPF